MAKKLAYEVDMDTQNATKNLKDVEQGVKGVGGAVGDLKNEEKKQANDRINQLKKQKKEQDEAINSMGLFGITIGGTKAAFKKMAMGAKFAFKSIKVGLISTGIGIFVVAIGAMVASFQNSKKSVEKLEVAFAQIGAVVKVLIDRFAKVGGAIRKVFSGDFKGALKDTKEAFTGLNAEIKEEVKLMGDLMKAEQLLKDSKRDLNVAFAQQRAELEELKKIAEDTTKSQTERVNAAKTAFAMENEMMAKRVANAEEELRIQRERMSTSENLEEDYEKEAELLIAVANIKQESATKQIELNNKINSINREIEAQKEQARVKEEQQEKARLDAIKKEGDELAKLNQQREKESAERNKQYADVQLGLQDALSQQLHALEQSKLAEQKVLAHQFMYENLSFEEHQRVMAEIREKYNALEAEAILTQSNLEISEQFAKQDALMQQKLDFAGSMLSSIDSIGATMVKKEMDQLDKAFEQGGMSEEKYNKKKEQIEKKALAREKRMAMFQLLIDTASAVSSGIAGAMASATATGPGAVFSAPGFIASMIALAMSSVAQGYAILSQVPEGGGVSEPSASGGTGGGGSQEEEFVFNPDAFFPQNNDSGSNAPNTIQAFVVENQITDSQTLQEELEFQTTL